jgi:hypothetical protein
MRLGTEEKVTDYSTYGNADGVYSGILESVHVVLSEPSRPKMMSRNEM